MIAPKKHSLISYIFWSTAAATSGAMIFSLAATGTKNTFSILGSAAGPIIYEASAKETDDNAAAQSTDKATKNYSYKIKNNLPERKVSASAYLVADIDTGDVIIEKNKNSVFPIASVTKLMTAAVYLESKKPSQTTIVSSAASAAPKSRPSDLREGQIIPANELIYPLLLESSNVSAETIAENVGRKNFIGAMNAKALSMGARRTSFEDPSGVSPKNTSTASDLFKIISQLYNNDKYIMDITTRKEQLTSWQNLSNNDKLASLDGFLGGKTGFTNAAQKTFAGIFSLPLSDIENRKIAIVLLKSADREDDVLNILDYLQKNVAYN